VPFRLRDALNFNIIIITTVPVPWFNALTCCEFDIYFFDEKIVIDHAEKK